MLQAWNKTRNALLAEKVESALKLSARMKGLLGRSHLPQGHALLIRPCNSIHTFFMRFAIDAVFLSKEQQVLRIYQDIKPFRLTSLVPKARAVLELPAGTLRKNPVSPGDFVSLEEAR